MYTAVYTYTRAHGRVRAVYDRIHGRFRPCKQPVHGCVRSVHTARVHDPCVRRPVYTTVYGPCTCVHGPCTWPRNGHVHGLCTRIYVYMYTYIRVHGRERAVYTAVYVPCSRRTVYASAYTALVHEHVHGRVTAVHTVRVHEYGPCTRAFPAVHMARTRQCNGAHGRCRRIYVYTAVTRTCTGRPHGPYTHPYTRPV